jgi:hypothetical protein
MSGGGGGTISTSEPRLGAMRVQQSSYGLSLPIVYGRTRVTGNLIWYGDFVAIAHTTTTTSGGKGGGGGVTQQTTTYTYEAAVMMALCEGPVGGVASVWAGKKRIEKKDDKTPLEQLNLSFASGEPGQEPWGHLVTHHAGTHNHGDQPAIDEVLGYSNTAYVFGANYELTSNAEIQNHSFELDGKLQYGSGVVDANPRDVVYDLLTNVQYGANFPTSRIADLSVYSTYCRAMGLFISPSFSEQQEVQAHLRAIASLTNSAYIWSEGKLKIVPYGDEALSGYGATYAPNLTPIYDLSDDDFIVSGSEDPVKCDRSTPADAFNQVQIEYLNRASAYNVEIAEAKDQANIEKFGLRPQEPVKMHGICDASVARRVAQLLLQRALYVRNTYEFHLGWKYALLEPMDLVTLTDRGLGLAKTPVRIVSIEEDEEGKFTVRAEDYPFGVASATRYPSQAGTGYAANYNAAPGNVAVPTFFEPPIELTSTGLEVWCAVSGQPGSAGSFWGGCRVWASLDGNTYKQVGTVRGGARFGALTGHLSSGPGGSLPVALAGMGGQLLSGTAQDASLLNTLCWVEGPGGGEFLAYQTATLTGPNAYTLSGLVRAAYGSNPNLKIVGAKFVRIDQAIAKSDPFELSMVGKTIYFKFTSFNVYGGGEQALPDVSAYSYTITGNMLKLPPANVGTVQYVLEGFGIRITWPAVADQDLNVYELRTGGTSWENATLLVQVKGTSYQWATQLAGSKKVWVKAIDLYGNYSQKAALVTVGVPAPNASNLSASIVGPNVVLTWQAVSGAFNIDRYEVRRGASWASSTIITAPYTTTFSEKVTYLGARRYWVAAIDVAGNVGAPVSVDVTISPPAAVNIVSEVVDNNVLLRWTDATTTLPVERYEIRKGTAYDIGQQVGDNGNGRFAAFFEQAAGIYTYWIVAYDTAGNASAAASVSALVNQPPDYVLRNNYFSSFEGTRAGVWKHGDKLYAPLLDETWQKHFASRGWASPQAQIDAGYPQYFLPSGTASYYEEVIDYGTTLPSTAISSTPTMQVLFGAVNVTPTISTKKLASDPWTNYPGQSQIVASEFRYVKVRLDFTASGGDDLIEISSLNVKLSTKLKNDSGNGKAYKTDEGGTTVNFATNFIDVSSITVSPNGTSAQIGIYDFEDTPYPTSFKVLLYDTNGNRADGDFSWSAKGI